MRERKEGKRDFSLMTKKKVIYIYICETNKGKRDFNVMTKLSHFSWQCRPYDPGSHSRERIYIYIYIYIYEREKGERDFRLMTKTIYIYI